MNKIKTFLLIVTIIFSMQQFSHAADKVIVVPLNSASKMDTKLWGEGRVGVSATFNSTVNGTSLFRSNGMASWDGAAAACPRNTWVCSEAEALNLNTKSNTEPVAVISCSGNSASTGATWVQDQYSSSEGKVVFSFSGAAQTSNISKCNYLPVWCCASVN